MRPLRSAAMSGSLSPIAVLAAGMVMGRPAVSIRALMIDVDGVLVTGRPEDGRPWAVDLEKDLGIGTADLGRAFFVPFWDDVIVGRAQLLDRLAAALESLSSAVRAGN